MGSGSFHLTHQKLFTFSGASENGQPRKQRAPEAELQGGAVTLPQKISLQVEAALEGVGKARGRFVRKRIIGAGLPFDWDL